MRKRHVSPRLAALLAALALAGALAVVAGCESKPAAPAFNNPFDPGGPTGGDGLQVSAAQADTVIYVFWNQPKGMGIVSYTISYTTDLNGAWEELDSVEPTAADRGFYAYAYTEPSLLHYFRVQAFTDNDYSLVGYSPAASVVAPPRLVPATGGRLRASRYLDLEVTVGVGDTLELADNRYFDASRRIPVAALGEPQNIPWTLREGHYNDPDSVFLRVLGPGSAMSSRVKLGFAVGFHPRHYLPHKPATIASRSVDLVVPSEGVLAMRFALSADSLASAPWLAPADTVHGFLLAESANPQEVWGQFSGDFGYDTTYALEVTPDNLTKVTFSLDVPANRVITGPQVVCRSNAVATLMRIGESAAFAGVPWQPYASSAAVTLSPGEGRKVLYAQYRNDWTDSDVYSQYVDVVGQPLGVTILAPADGDAVLGGTALQVRGTSLAGTVSDKVDSVRLDLGDGQGWRIPSGTTSWELMWDVPTVTESTPVTLRARAWAVDTLATDTLNTVIDSVTTSVTVTVEPETP